MPEANPYEEQRRRRVEEILRKQEELGVPRLSAAVREAAARPKPMPARQKPKAPVPGELRRSVRVASLPYNHGGYEAHAAARQKAEELQGRIHGIGGPAFVKPLTHVLASKPGVMLIPKSFMEYLPAHDEEVVVVDQQDNEFHMTYIARYPYLRKEWRKFADHHGLAAGDCLVFQLTERAKFKVYVFRAKDEQK